MLPLQRILCPTDFSDFSYDAIEMGAELARHFGAELCVLNVTQPMPEMKGVSDYPQHNADASSPFEHAVIADH